MFIQIYNGRIVRVSEEQMLEDDIQIDLPDDFDYDHIDRYEVADGELVKHDIEEQEIPESGDSVWDALDAAYREGVDSV